jgi:hypothetical protein
MRMAQTTCAYHRSGTTGCVEEVEQVWTRTCE